MRYSYKGWGRFYLFSFYILVAVFFLFLTCAVISIDQKSTDFKQWEVLLPMILGGCSLWLGLKSFYSISFPDILIVENGIFKVRGLGVIQPEEIKEFSFLCVYGDIYYHGFRVPISQGFLRISIKHKGRKRRKTFKVLSDKYMSLKKEEVLKIVAEEFPNIKLKTKKVGTSMEIFLDFENYAPELA